MTTEPWNPVKTGFALILIIVAMVFVPFITLDAPRMALFLVQVLMALFLAFLGKALVGRIWGVFIDDQLSMSVSRFQLVLWSVMVLSAVLVIGVRHAAAGGGADLKIDLDWTILAALGISATSTIAAPAIRATKDNFTPDPSVLAKAGAAYNMTALEVQNESQGLNFPNANVKEAKFTDMFQGDEVGNSYLLDMGKVQMFFFTIMAIVVYEAQLVTLLMDVTPGDSDIAFPKLAEGIVSLMGISHAGYLASKAVKVTPTVSDPDLKPGAGR